eukprot:6125417-Alexandrium_andersonii.AAC.1
MPPPLTFSPRLDVRGERAAAPPTPTESSADLSHPSLDASSSDAVGCIPTEGAPGAEDVRPNCGDLGLGACLSSGG